MKCISALKLKPKNISFKKIKHKKRIAVIIILLIVVSIIGAVIFKPKETLVTDYTELTREDIIRNVNTLGTVESNSKVNVYSTLNKIVKEVDVEVGDKVNEGDILCLLDSSDIERDIAETSKNAELEKQKAKVDMDSKKQIYDNASFIYNSNIDASIADCKEALNVAQIKLDDSKKDYEHKKVLYDNGACTQSDLDDAKSALDQAQSDYDKSYVDLENAKVKAKQEVDNAKNEYDSAVVDYSSNKDEILLQGKKDDLDKCIIKAPASGTITAVNTSVGNAAEGILFTIEDLSDPVIVVNVKEIDVNKVMPGQKAEVSTDAAPDDQYAFGKVIDINDTVKDSDSSSKSSTSNDNNSSSSSTSAVFEARITLDDPNAIDFIKVGMNAKANIILEKKENAFSVPFTSILEEDSGKFIEIARENEEGRFEVKKVPVTTGIETDISVEIESDDLNEGDKLIMDPTLYEEGQIITLAADNGGGTYE